MGVVPATAPARVMPAAARVMSAPAQRSEHGHDASAADILATIDKAVAFADKKSRLKMDERNMVKSNHMVTLHIVIHEGKGEQHSYRMTVMASVQFNHMREAIIERLSDRLAPSSKLRLSWLKADGELVELRQEAWRDYVFAMWCTQPWVVHAHDESKRGGGGDEVEIPLDRIALSLFERYDLNRNGFIERTELWRLLKDARLERLEEFGCDVPEVMVQRFLEHEFTRLDTDASGGIELGEFTTYVTRMKAWMRAELLRNSNESATFERSTGKAIEKVLPPAVLPKFVAGAGDDGSEVAIVETGCFGIRVEVPRDALPPPDHAQFSVRVPQVSVRTLSEPSVSYLAEGDDGAAAAADSSAFGEARRQLKMGALSAAEDPSGSSEGFYQTPFSPVVRIDYPAFGGAEAAAPELGSPPAPRFRKPLTLVIPHCFDAREDAESIAMVAGAAHGSGRWAPVASDDPSDPSDGIDIVGKEMRVSIPYAGIFCAFAKQSAFAVVLACRFHVFAMPELSRHKPSGLRVQLCPELPNQIEEMQVAESSRWGLSTCVGASQLLYLTKGVRFKVRFGEEEKELTWVGLRGHVSFAIPAVGGGGRAAHAEDSDQRQILDGAICIEMLAGIGPRASQVKQCARLAGMRTGTLEVPFGTRILTVQIPKPPVLRLRERGPHDFTVTWKKPVGADASGREVEVEVTHYQLEIATTAASSGTYFPWQVLWCGAGVESPDPRLAMAQRKGEAEKIARLTKELELERLDEVPKAGLSATAKMQGRTETEAKAAEQPPKPVFSYCLPVEPSLFGKLRIRCWVRGEERPSSSSQVILPRWNGAPGVDNKLQQVIDERASHFRQLTCHVSAGFEPVHHRIGNPAGRNVWGGDAPPPPPPPSAKEKAMGQVMAAVPYDVPRLPKELKGVDEAGEALARFYRECGVHGGGGGELFGLRIDLVLHAIAGTPTENGASSPSRTVAGFGEPLMALCEVAYADVLVELFDEAAVLKSQWQWVSEQIFGVVSRVAQHREHYALCEPRVKEVLFVMIELWETVRQCGVEEALTFHLQHENYKSAVKKALAAELTERIHQLSARLSSELLQLLRLVPDGFEPRHAEVPASADLLEQLLTPAAVSAPDGGQGAKGKSRFQSLKRAVSTRSALSGVFGRAQDKSLARQIEEMCREADARAAAEEGKRRALEKIAEEAAALTLQGAQRGRVARGPRGRVAVLRRERTNKEAAVTRAAKRAAAMEALEEAQRYKAASKMQARQKGILARERTTAMRAERDGFRKRMMKLRFALKARAAATKIAMQLAEEAAKRRAQLVEEATEEYRVTDERLDILELADASEGSNRQAAWAALKENVVRSAMIPVAMGLAVRTRPLYLEQDPAERQEGKITNTSRAAAQNQPRAHKAVWSHNIR